jgi:chorismate mutase
MTDMTPEDKTSASDSDVEDWWRGDRAQVVQRIDTLRDEIDRLDEVIVRLLNARARCALNIGGLKKLLALEIYQPAREEAVLRHVRQVNPGPLDADAIARLFERIIDEARRLERVMQEQETQSPGAEPDPDSTSSGGDSGRK